MTGAEENLILEALNRMAVSLRSKTRNMAIGTRRRQLEERMRAAEKLAKELEEKW